MFGFSLFASSPEPRQSRSADRNSSGSRARSTSTTCSELGRRIEKKQLRLNLEKLGLEHDEVLFKRAEKQHEQAELEAATSKLQQKSRHSKARRSLEADIDRHEAILDLQDLKTEIAENKGWIESLASLIRK